MTALPFSISLCDEINLLRQNPPAYAVHVQAHLDRFIDDYIYKKPTGSKIRTKEGVKSKLNTLLILLLLLLLSKVKYC